MTRAELFDLSGQVAVVTGAASGLGLAYAEVLAQNGAHVLLTDINPDTLDAQTKRLRDLGCDVAGEVLDITDAARQRTVIDTLAETRGRLDIVFANAGISGGPGYMVDPGGSITEIDLPAYRQVLEVNLTGNLMTMSIAARHMKRQRRGSIVATISVAGLMAEPIVGYPYVTAKAALANAVRQAAIDLAPFNVRVNGIAPGPFYTNIADGHLHRDPEAARKFAKAVALQRIAQPDEIKGLALLLASPASGYITGTVIPIDGGQTCVLPMRFEWATA